MAHIQSMLAIQIAPTAAEVCTVISAVAAYHQGEEERFLLDIQAAIKARLLELAAAQAEEPVVTE